MNRPNILYIHSHDTGRYIQPYGYGLPSPHLQQLADRGVLFRQHHTSAPTCSPSRATLVTGQCAHSCGMLGLAHRGHALNDYSHHLLHTLREHGYRSELVGVQHIAEDAAAIGYDKTHWPGSNADDIAARASGVLQGLKENGTPFFLSVGFFDTHRPFPEVPEDAGKNLRPPAPLPDTPEVRRDLAAYAVRLGQFDRAVGTVMSVLDELGLADTTLVICTTDHGIAFPFMKCSLTDHGTGIMLIMRGPGGFAGGKTVDGMTSHEDIFPTICELLGIAVPDRVQGASLLPLVRGEKAEVHDELYGEVTYHAAYEPMRSVRTTRWKYIRRYEHRTAPVLPNIDEGYSKTYLLGRGLRDREPEMEQLYDLMFDPHETRNLAADPAMAPVRADMRQRLHNWMERTGDPLLAGPVIVKGAQTSDPDGMTPQDGITVIG